MVRFRRMVRRPKARQAVRYSIVLDGMPEVHLSHAPVSPREYIPWLWIYVPVVAKWFLLALRHRSLTLPTAANPTILSGGFRGEEKSSYLEQIGPDQKRWVAPWTAVRLPKGSSASAQTGTVERHMAGAGLAYPLIVKPDVGCCGFGVRLVRDRCELSAYLTGFPSDQRLVLQQYVPWDGEAGIFYIRDPATGEGRIYSLGLRYYPHVVGDGRSTLRQLIRADRRASRRARLHFREFAARLDEVPAKGSVVRLATVANLRVGALYRDGSAHITEPLRQQLDRIARSMRDFHYGRFDVRFRSIEALERGEDFLIVEVNGAGAEAIHIWDPALTIRDAYRIWFEQHEILFAIAACNRARGAAPLGLWELIVLQWGESRLLRRYPPSN